MKIECKKPHKITLISNVEIEIDDIEYEVEVTFEVFPDKNKKKRIECVNINTDCIPDKRYHKPVKEHIEYRYEYWYKLVSRFIRDIEGDRLGLLFDPEIDD